MNGTFTIVSYPKRDDKGRFIINSREDVQNLLNIYKDGHLPKLSDDLL